MFGSSFRLPLKSIESRILMEIQLNGLMRRSQIYLSTTMRKLGCEHSVFLKIPSVQRLNENSNDSDASISATFLAFNSIISILSKTFWNILRSSPIMNEFKDSLPKYWLVFESAAEVDWPSSCFLFRDTESSVAFCGLNIEMVLSMECFTQS